MTTETTSVAELKANLSRYLAKARSGVTVEVTSRRKPVARLVGIPKGTPDELARLIAEGRVTWGGGPKPRGAAVHLDASGKTLAEMVTEDRGRS